MGVPLENGSKNRRRRAPNTQRITPARSPAKGSRRKSNDVTVKSETDLLEQSKGSHDVTVKSEIDLLEQSKLALMEQSPDLGDIPVKRPVGRPRKAKWMLDKFDVLKSVHGLMYIISEEPEKSQSLKDIAAFTLVQMSVPSDMCIKY